MNLFFFHPGARCFIMRIYEGYLLNMDFKLYYLICNIRQSCKMAAKVMILPIGLQVQHSKFFSLSNCVVGDGRDFVSHGCCGNGSSLSPFSLCRYIEKHDCMVCKEVSIFFVTPSLIIPVMLSSRELLSFTQVRCIHPQCLLLDQL